MIRERRRIPGPGATAMFVVAGLPRAVHDRAPSILQQLVPGESKAVALASTEADGSLYPEKLVSGIVRALTNFVVRRRTKGPEHPSSPASITLLYVPASDDERLLRRLDFAVFPIPLHELGARDAQGRQLRHSYDAIKAALVRAVDSAGPAKRNLSLVKERINRLVDSEPLLLPPRNFHLDREARIESLFQMLLRGERSWTDRMTELRLRTFTKDDLPRLPWGQTRKAFQDYRNMVFLTAHQTAFHGTTRETKDDAPESELLSLLKGLYRFGVALPDGFHHDVQFERAMSLDGVEFECGRMGKVRGLASHANIYADDFVRIAGKAKINAAN
jgi:hypothetical protein